MNNPSLSLTIPGLAASITRKASSQSYYTIRYLADRERIPDAYRAYAYFRWVDNELDGEAGGNSGNESFVERQSSLLESCYRQEPMPAVDCHEQMLIDLVRNNGARNDGLRIYLHDMMTVMSFDAGRRGRLISQFELNEYTRYLASAVTEAMHHFVGHDCDAPNDETRYMAVTAAHITHMLRDTLDDIQVGYYNIPREVLAASRISPTDVQAEAYREWVKCRVQLAREHFRIGREYLLRVENARCRLAGCAYASRFEGVLDTIEQDGYLLRKVYPERRGMGAIARAAGSMFHMVTERHHRQLAPANQPSLREL